MWEEFSQWGARAKLIAINGSLVARSNILSHYAYPPGTALFYYWFFAFSHYSEGLVHFGQQLLMILPLGVLVKDYVWERWQRAFLVISFAVLILLLLGMHMASDITLRVNNIVGIFLGGMLVSYFGSERKITDILFLLPVAFFFITLKPDVFGFLIFTCVVLTVDQCIFTQKHIFERLAAVVLLLSVGLVSHWSWHMFLYQHGLSLIPYFQVLPTWPLTPQEITMSTYFFWVVLKHVPAVIAILLIVIANLILAKEKDQRNEVILLHVFMLVGYLFYVVVLLGVYLYGFGESQIQHFASIDVYLRVYYIAWSLLAFSTLLSVWSSDDFKKIRFVPSLLIVVALIAFPSYLFYTHYLHIEVHSRSYSLWRLRQSLHPVVAASNGMLPKHTRVFIVWQNSAGFEHAVLGYSLIPRKVNPQPSSFGKPYGPQDKWTVNSSPLRLKQLMQNYDYVLLAYTDQQFWNRYGFMFKNRHAHQLVQYLICKKPGFNGFGKPGCFMLPVMAYLYKVHLCNL